MNMDKQPEKLLEFKRVTHVIYATYTMSNWGMQRMATEIKNTEGYNPDGVFQIGTPDKDGNRQVFAQLGNDPAVKGMKKDGLFSQLIAHGLICWLYSLWDEGYREKIATELGEKKNALCCDVMGDIRIIRNLILHNNAVADSRISNLKVLTWVEEGVIVFTGESMQSIQEAINTMSVYSNK